MALILELRPGCETRFERRLRNATGGRERRGQAGLREEANVDLVSERLDMLHNREGHSYGRPKSQLRWN